MLTLLCSALLALPIRHDDGIAELVDEVIAEFAGADAFVGLSVAVGMKGEVVFAGGYGLAEVEHDVRADAETVFRIGSITKQFTAAAICRLAEKGKLFYDDDMHDYVPDFDTQGRVVTIRHLLTHTSGIPSYTALGPEWDRIVPLELTTDELLAYVEHKPFDFEPGTSYSYNNTGFFLLGVIIEEITGKTYAEYIETEFCQPLGLTRTRYGSNIDIIKNRAQGYQVTESGIANDELIGMSQPYAAGSLIASAHDLVKWKFALVAGRVVSAESYEEMTTPYFFEDMRDTSYGFGLSVAESDGRPCISHGGGINGFNSMLRYYPEDDFVVAVISNSEGLSADAVTSRLVEALLP
jgi:D-alanyl-D-alanine carboxypeptidase